MFTRDEHARADTVPGKPKPICGSYAPEDCLFLMKPIEMDYQTIANKEALIQSGALHYSEMIHQERAPSEDYITLFHQMMTRYRRRLAQELLTLADLIHEHRPPTRSNREVVVLSLARAGTPIGVLLHRALRQFYDRASHHYAVSIIRDRGIDTTALSYVLNQGHLPSHCLFVDGWTAKGVITRELHTAVEQFNQTHQVTMSPALYVVSDIGGTADHCATLDDYTIPSALLNATISGLISRSILNGKISPNDFHGCVQYNHLAPHDLSNWFVDEIFTEMCALKAQGFVAQQPPTIQHARRAQASAFLSAVQSTYHVSDINRVKPGIAEATRVLLRRVPDRLLLRQKGHDDTQHLEQLAKEKQVPISERPDMPFGACALIKDVAQ